MFSTGSLNDLSRLLLCKKEAGLFTCVIILAAQSGAALQLAVTAAGAFTTAAAWGVALACRGHAAAVDAQLH